MNPLSLTRPVIPASSPASLRVLLLKPSFSKFRPPQAISPLGHFKQLTPIESQFATFATTANRPNYHPKPPLMESKPTESDPPSGEDFIHIENPNPSVVDSLSESIVNVEVEAEEEEYKEEGMRNEDYDNSNNDVVSRSETSDSSERRKVELPEELSRSVMVLTCESSADGGSCDVYLVGTAHVSQARAASGFCLIEEK